MSLKLSVTAMIFICTVIYSKNKYVTLKNKLRNYQKLEEFAKNAFVNLNGAFEDISSILSETFNTPIPTNSNSDTWISLGFSDNESKEIMDYIISYTQLDISTLRDASLKFAKLTAELYRKQEEKYRRLSPSLLCPPICALIVMILIL